MPNKQGGYGGYKQPQRSERPRQIHTNANVRPLRQDLHAADPGWYRPAADPAAAQRQARAMARRARQIRRNRRRLAIAGVVAGILLLAGVITLLLPEDPNAITSDTDDLPAPPAVAQLVAPLPYGGGEGSATLAVDWGQVGPVRQQQDYTYTAAPAAGAEVPEFGRVETSWFGDAAFLGDSLTVGFQEYSIDVGGALICGYTGASPNQVVNRAELNNDERGAEVPMDVLAAAQPRKLYVLMGTNALRLTEEDDGFLNYYGRMLDELRAALPETMIFVQAVLPVRPEALEDSPGLASDRLARINAALAQQCQEKGLYYLDLNAEFSGPDGALDEAYAAPDGIHLTVEGYRKWVTFLCTHTPYNKNNPYQPGSSYYLDDNLKSLLADLP